MWFNNRSTKLIKWGLVYKLLSINFWITLAHIAETCKCPKVYINTRVCDSSEPYMCYIIFTIIHIIIQSPQNFDIELQSFFHNHIK